MHRHAVDARARRASATHGASASPRVAQQTSTRSATSCRVRAMRAPECAFSGAAPRINARLARESDARGRRDDRRDIRRFGTVNGGAAASVANDLVDFLNDSWTAHHAT